MGFILFLILACGLPGLMLYSIRQRVPEEAWALSPTRRPEPMPVARGSERAGDLGEAEGGGGTNRRLENITAIQGADIEHGLTSNAARIGGTDRRADGTLPIGSAPGHGRDGGSQAEEAPRNAAAADERPAQQGNDP
ncbi:hypothetical protein [Methylobacterium sp. ID0610]|uniref:hypothetical protein n=1 Tax=Methylobacterium carpenticola TaxID=3344827 RepID=UPI0036909C33